MLLSVTRSIFRKTFSPVFALPSPTNTPSAIIAGSVSMVSTAWGRRVLLANKAGAVCEIVAESGVSENVRGFFAALSCLKEIVLSVSLGAGWVLVPLNTPSGSAPLSDVVPEGLGTECSDEGRITGPDNKLIQTGLGL